MNISLSKKDDGYHLATFELVNEVNADPEQVFTTLEELGAFIDSAATVEKVQTETAIALEIKEAAPDTALSEEAAPVVEDTPVEATPEVTDIPVDSATDAPAPETVETPAPTEDSAPETAPTE